MKLLLTAFDAFGGDTVNSASCACDKVKERSGIEIIKLTVPTVFSASDIMVYEAMKNLKPDVVLCTGQAGGRAAITAERIAVNICDARIEDNNGYKPVDVPVKADGDAAYFSNLPVREICNELIQNGIPSEVSNTAGTFVCNALMYNVLYYIQKEFKGMLGGFIHVPLLPRQIIGSSKKNSAMPVECISKGLDIAIDVIYRKFK